MLTLIMAASPSDFTWYHDAKDEYPIGQGPPPLSTASTPVDPITPTSSAGPLNCVRQLRGQPKIAITTAFVGHRPIKAVSKPRCASNQKRPHSDDGLPSRELRPRKAQGTVIAIDSDPETDSASDDQGSDSDDDGDGNLVIKDKSVSCSPFIYMSTILLTFLPQKRASSHRVRSKDKHRADLDLVYKAGVCIKGGETVQGWWCILCKYVW